MHNYASPQTAKSQQSVQTLLQKTPPLSKFLVAYWPIPNRNLTLTSRVILLTVVSSLLTEARLYEFNVHYLGSSENKAWKKIQACTGFEPMTSVLPGITFIHVFIRSSNVWLSYILNRLFITSRVYLEPTSWPAPSWLVSSVERCIGIAEVMGSNPVSGLIFTTAQVVHIIARITFVHILSTSTRLLIPLSAFGIDLTLPLPWPDISFGTLHLLLEPRFHPTLGFDLWVGQFVKSSISFGVSKMPARDKTRSTSFSGSENLQLRLKWWLEMSF